MESSSEELSQSLNGSQYDAQNTSEEWTIISDEENDCPEFEADKQTNIGSVSNESSENKCVLPKIHININNCDENQNNEDIDKYVKQEEEEEETQIPDSTNNSSDIDVIDEEDDSSDDELSTASLCSSSVVSQMSNLSFLRDQYLLRAHLNPESINEDLSEASSLNYREFNSEFELNRGPRAYVHTPNTGLNGKLNLILILSVFTVMGLGIGNYIGWSNHWRHNRQLSLGQVLKLKQLQDELVVCMQNQANKSPLIDGKTPQVCYTDNDYWRAKFQNLFSENKDLLGLLEKTQKHYHLNGNTENILSDKECVNKSTSDEFHSLKLGFLVNQMEHLQLLKTLEEVQHKGRQSEKKVQDLEVENSKLKMKLVEEEEDDKEIVQLWGNKVRVLEDENKELQKRLETDEEEDSIQLKRLNDRISELVYENNELKSAINQLEAQVVMADPNHNTASVFTEYSMADQNNYDKSSPIKLDLLKQRINQMVIENDELKSTIARLRWAYHQNQEEPNSEETIEEESEEEMSTEDISQLEDELNQLKDLLSSEQNESKKWKQMYEKLMKEREETKSSKNNKNNGFSDENVIYDWVLNSTNVLKEALIKGSGVVGNKLKDIFDKFSENQSLFSDELSMGINATQTVFFELNRRLQNKWKELQDLKDILSKGNQKISNKMSRLLERTIQKLQSAGNKLLSKEERLKSRFDAFSNRISKLIVDLDNKWNNLLNKLSDRYSKQQKSDDFENTESKNNWFFERANSRRQERSTSNTEPPKSDPEFNRFVINDNDDDQEQFTDDDTDSGNEETKEEENWFLRKAKKPKTNDYEFEAQYQKTRRNTHRSKHFTHKFDYSWRQR